MRPSDEMVQTALQTWFKTHPLDTPITGSDERDMRAILSAALTAAISPEGDDAELVERLRYFAKRLGPVYGLYFDEITTISKAADRLAALKEGS